MKATETPVSRPTSNSIIKSSMINRPNVGCVIMASGLGKRFGSNKLLADFNGKPLIQWTIDKTKDLFSKLVVVTRSIELADLCKSQKIPYVLHQEPGRNDTIRLGLEYLGNDIDGAMFIPGDQPLISVESLEKLLKAFSNESHIIWRSSYEEIIGTPVIFPNKFFPELKNLPHKKGGSIIINNYPDSVKQIYLDNSFELLDVDSPEDLIKLQNLSDLT